MGASVAHISYIELGFFFIQKLANLIEGMAATEKLYPSKRVVLLVFKPLLSQNLSSL